jgi:hypothetical protein
MNITSTIQHYTQNLTKAIRFSVNTRQKKLVVALLSSISFIVFVGLTFPRYAIELLAAGVSYWDDAFTSLIWLMKESSGILGVVLMGIYAIATGILLSATLGSIKYKTNQKHGWLSVLPAIIFSGCASCGAGILGVIGAFGLASVLPFNGNLIRVAGILLVLIVLAKMGDPRECVIKPN